MSRSLEPADTRDAPSPCSHSYENPASTRAMQGDAGSRSVANKEQPVSIDEEMQKSALSPPAYGNVGSEDHSESGKAGSWVSLHTVESQHHDGILIDQLPDVISLAPNHVTNLEKDVVGWDSETDPNIPTNFTPLKKWVLVALVSLTKLSASFTLDALAPALLNIQRSFDGESHAATKTQLVMTICIVGYAVGPMLLNPMSDIYGRKVVVTSASVCSCLCIAACALAPSQGLLVLFRFLGGVADSPAYVTSDIIASDLFLTQSRAAPLAVWNLTILVGATVGGLVGATITDHLGWRWVSWICCILTAVTGLARALFSCETNHEVLVQRKTRNLQKELHRPELRSCYVEDPDKPQPNLGLIVWRSLARSLKTLVTSPAILFLSLPYGYVTAYSLILASNIPIVFQSIYHWTLSSSGHLYLATLLGETMGLTALFLFHDKMVAQMMRANSGVYKPGMRLRGSSGFIFAAVAGILLYGWGSAEKIHWAVPGLGLVIFASAFAAILVVVPVYCIGAYPTNIAPSLAALNLLRAVSSTLVPLSGFAALDRLGIGWSSTVYALILAAMIPIPLLVSAYGSRIHEALRCLNTVGFRLSDGDPNRRMSASRPAKGSREREVSDHQ